MENLFSNCVLKKSYLQFGNLTGYITQITLYIKNIWNCCIKYYLKLFGCCRRNQFP